MKGIILAGGSGTRLYPITEGVSKQALPIYDKPMIYYPLSVLMLMDIRDILIITTPNDINTFERMLGDGSMFGIHLSYKIQERPEGIAQSFIIGKEFIGNDDVCLILGDNIFHGNGLYNLLTEARNVVRKNEACVFGYYVKDPERYGVADFDQNGKCISIEEKPIHPKTNYAVVGLYLYPNDVVSKAEKLKPSKRGELEITTLNQLYLNEDRLNVKTFGRGFAWLDTGTFESLFEASAYVETVENRQGLKIACLEEIAYNKKWITKDTLFCRFNKMKNNSYGEYLKKLYLNG